MALGGSRAAGTADAASDWDLGLYYRREIDLTVLARHGEVHPPGSWGRLMNGGAWLTVEGLKPFHVIEWVDGKPTWGPNHRRGGITAVRRAICDSIGRIPFSPTLMT